MPGGWALLVEQCSIACALGEDFYFILPRAVGETVTQHTVRGRWAYYGNLLCISTTEHCMCMCVRVLLRLSLRQLLCVCVLLHLSLKQLLCVCQLLCAVFLLHLALRQLLNCRQQAQHHGLRSLFRILLGKYYTLVPMSRDVAPCPLLHPSV
eukprot:878666-Pelagomonas_calceolata.AAC.4